MALAKEAEAADGKHVDVVFVAPPECPSIDVFRRALLERVPDALDHVDLFVAVHVALARNESASAQIAGLLVLVRPDGTRVTRHLDADRCEEVVDGLALMAAIAFENERQTSSSKRTQQEPRPLARTPFPRETSPLTPTTRSHPLRTSAALSGELVGGVTSKPLWTIRSSFELALGSPTIFAPSLRASFVSSIPTHLDPPAGGDSANPGARAHWTAGALSVCPVRFTLSSWAHARPCVEGDLGFVRLSGPEGGRPRTANRFWAHTAALVRFDAEVPWVIGDRKEGALFFELEGGVVVPLTRYMVTFGGATLYTVAAASFQAGAALGVRF